MNKDNGYVYILSNPSFCKDWGKICKNSRPANVRSKELDKAKYFSYHGSQLDELRKEKEKNTDG